LQPLKKVIETFSNANIKAAEASYRMVLCVDKAGKPHIGDILFHASSFLKTPYGTTSQTWHLMWRDVSDIFDQINMFFGT